MSQQTPQEIAQQAQEIKDSLVALLEGKDKRLTIIAALSIATTTAHMINMPMLDLQSMIVRMYQKRRDGQ